MGGNQGSWTLGHAFNHPKGLLDVLNTSRMKSWNLLEYRLPKKLCRIPHRVRAPAFVSVLERKPDVVYQIEGCPSFVPSESVFPMRCRALPDKATGGTRWWCQSPTRGILHTLYFLGSVQGIFNGQHGAIWVQNRTWSLLQGRANYKGLLRMQKSVLPWYVWLHGSTQNSSSWGWGRAVSRVFISYTLGSIHFAEWSTVVVKS